LFEHFFSLTLSEFVSLIKNKLGKREFYSHAIYSAIYKKGNITIEDMPEFVKVKQLRNSFLEFLPQELLEISQIQESNGLTKFITVTEDQLEIESVVIPMSHYNTLCISSQIGCKMGCTFCETGKMGLIRSLEVFEIITQVYLAIFQLKFDIKNIVFMGMGEPFDNFDNVIQAVKILTEPKGFSFSKSNITISTVGRIDGIKKLAKLNWPRLNLAISLNAPNNLIRSEIMPINRTTPLEELQKVLMEYPLRKSGIILIEYVLIKDVNDSDKNVEELVEFLLPLRARLNLIAYNPGTDTVYKRPSEEEMFLFYKKLADKNVFLCRRKSRGTESMAACGQLGNLKLREALSGK